MAPYTLLLIVELIQQMQCICAVSKKRPTLAHLTDRTKIELVLFPQTRGGC